MSQHNTSRDAGTRRRLAVDTDLTIYHATALKRRLFDALSATDHLELELSAVGDIDTAGLQLLILLKREALTQGRQASFTGHSPAVREAVDFCNLAALFGDPIVIPA